MPKIILQDYTKTLRGKTVLDHIDLTLEGLGLIHAGQAFHLADQLPGFLHYLSQRLSIQTETPTFLF